MMSPKNLLPRVFFIDYDPSLVSIVSVDAYDGSLPGPWDREMTNKAPDPKGPGSSMVQVGNLGSVSPDAGGDIPIARVRVECTSPGDDSLTFSVVSGFDTVVGNSGKLYDAEIIPNTIVIVQDPNTSSTTTCPPGVICLPCPSEAIYGEHSEEKELLRHFRDDVLRNTSEGRELITLYYQWSPALTKAVKDDASLRKELMELIDSVLPMIKQAVE